MARETKVGLIVGLAFIICFALVLANRGEQGIPIETAGSIAARGESKGFRSAPRGAGTGVKTTEPARAVSGGDQVATASGTMTSTASIAQPSTPPRTDRDAHASSPPLGMQTLGQGGVVFQQPGESKEAMDERVRLLEQQQQQLADLLNRKSPDPLPVGLARGAETGAVLTATPAVNQIVAPAPTATEPSAQPAGRRHVIGSGDTLSRLAEQYYGSKSGRLVTLIFEANKAVLSDINKVPLGVELVIPAHSDAVVKAPAGAGSRASAEKQATVEKPAAVGVKPAAVAAKPSRTGKPDTAAAKKSGPAPSEASKPKDQYRWYQVKTNDRYASIARQQLGNETRWREIFELNRDKFPKEGMIREGVRIKLPAAEGLADAQGKKH